MNSCSHCLKKREQRKGGHQAVLGPRKTGWAAIYRPMGSIMTFLPPPQSEAKRFIVTPVTPETGKPGKQAGGPVWGRKRALLGQSKLIARPPSNRSSFLFLSLIYSLGTERGAFGSWDLASEPFCPSFSPKWRKLFQRGMGWYWDLGPDG